jgi:hypothetical protein
MLTYKVIEVNKMSFDNNTLPNHFAKAFLSTLAPAELKKADAIRRKDLRISQAKYSAINPEKTVKKSRKQEVCDDYEDTSSSSSSEDGDMLDRLQYILSDIEDDISVTETYEIHKCLLRKDQWRSKIVVTKILISINLPSWFKSYKTNGEMRKLVYKDMEPYTEKVMRLYKEYYV